MGASTVEASPAGLPLMTEREAADFLNLTPRFLQIRRMSGDGPPFVRISARAVRYRPEDLQSWVEERIRTSTSDEGGPRQ